MTKSPFLKKTTLFHIDRLREILNTFKYMYIALAMSENFTITFNA